MLAAPARPAQARPKVLFVSADASPVDGSRLYRCTFQAKQLQNAGVEARVAFRADVTPEQLDAADVLIFSRCAWDENVGAWIRRARAQQKLVCADLDDKIFTPWDVDAKGLLRSRALVKRDMRARTRVAAHEQNVLRLLVLMDVVLASTSALAEALQELGLPAQVSRNAIDTEFAAPRARARSRLGRLLIMSGTPTHDADLRSIARPLARFLYENPNVECTFLGPVERGTGFCGLANARPASLLPIGELSAFVAEHDLCLVPLENTRFNECKSAVKFVESGLVSVPVLASPRREYRHVVRAGENGFLADDEASWYTALTMLRDRRELLVRAAEQAHRSVLSEHTVASRGSELADFLERTWRTRVPFPTSSLLSVPA